MSEYFKHTVEWLYDACYYLASSTAECQDINHIYESELPLDEQKKRFIEFIAQKSKLHPEKEAEMQTVLTGCELY